MMNYLAKYSIAQCVFPIKNTNTFKDITFIGILELTPKGILETDFSQIDADLYIKRAICVESKLGGGISFPMRERVAKIMSEEHSDLINAFLDTIPQEKIVLFDDGERYAGEMMLLMMQLAQKKGKHITCINVEPVKFLGRRYRKEFDICWKEIQLEADKSILFDLPPIEPESNTMTDYFSVRRNEIFKYVYKFWKKLNKQR